MKKLREVADELEDANYHRECQFLTDLADFIEQADENNDELLPNDILDWIAEYSWLA